MRILVVGAGALGSLVGGLLSVNHDVTIIGRPEQVWVLKRKGLRIEGITQGEFRPKALSGIPRNEEFQLIIICVKSYNTDISMEPLTPLLTKGTPILSLQNGLDNEEKILNFIRSRGLSSHVIGGITCHGVTYKGPGLVKHAGVGETIIGHFGPVPGGDEKIGWDIGSIARTFTDAGLEVQTTSCIDREIWAKTIINSAINPLTAIVGGPNGVIIENEELNGMARDLISEGVLIATIYGIDLTDEEMFDRTFKVAERTSRNHSSMYQDIKLKRRTEVDSINGALYEKARQKSVDAPLNLAMVRLIKGLEVLNLSR
ncbi:MAG: ketopantoate reductase family protein [Candidatus Thermoplasmatota archaeon]|nr:ketopantoate reductase family protein [Candidatus Thermoplasmatota archaeon]